MKIANKLIIAFMVVVMLSSVSGVVGLVLLNSITNGYSTALTKNGFVLGDIGEYNTYLQRGAAMTRDIIMLTDKADLANAQESLDKAIAASEVSMENIKASCTTAEEIALIKKIEETLPFYREARDKAIAKGLENEFESALEIFREEAVPYLDLCVETGKTLMETARELGTNVSKDLMASERAGMITIIVVTVFSVFSSVFIALIVSKKISAPINLCTDRLVLLSKGDVHTSVSESTNKDETGVMLNALKSTVDYLDEIIGDIGHGLSEIADNNLTVVPTVEFKGDFVKIEKSFDKILSSLNSILGQINKASDEVSSGSEQVSAGAQALSEGTAEQASSIETLAGTIEKISAHINKNATNANKASNEAVQASHEMTESNRKMQALIEAMSEIRSTSQKISNVIKTIEDIAFQTNILALNAAVEAARAGEAGKGFAVVADEVRNLASKSAEAANSTTSLIEAAVSAVANGNSLADDTAKSLEIVVGNATTVSQIVSEISAATNEQAKAISNVMEGIEQISSVVQTNSATAEESAASSEELSGQAELLHRLTSRFTLR